MTDLQGTWNYESSDNLDEFLKARGVNFMKRKMAKTLKPSQIISVSGDTWTIEVKSMLKNSKQVFNLGKESEEETPDGELCTSCVTSDSSAHLLCVQTTKEHRVVYTRRLTDTGKMHITMECAGVTATRVFTRAPQQ